MCTDARERLGFLAIMAIFMSSSQLHFTIFAGEATHASMHPVAPWFELRVYKVRPFITAPQHSRARLSAKASLWVNHMISKVR